MYFRCLKLQTLQNFRRFLFWILFSLKLKMVQNVLHVMYFVSPIFFNDAKHSSGEVRCLS